MIGKLGRTAVAVLAAAAAMTGCGSGGGDDRSGGGATGPQATAWVDRMCSTIGDVADTVARQRAVDTSDTAALPVLYSGQLREIGSSVDGVAARMTEMGPPPVADGARVWDDLNEAVLTTRDAIASSERAIAASNASSPVGLVQTQRAVETGYTAGRVLLNELAEQDDLRDAFSAAPSCREVDARADDRPGSA